VVIYDKWRGVSEIWGYRTHGGYQSYQLFFINFQIFIKLILVYL